MAVAVCPSCEGEIKLVKKAELGQKIRCPHCFEDLEVIETNPVELDWAYDEDDLDEDWEDFDEDEDTDEDW